LERASDLRRERFGPQSKEFSIGEQQLAAAYNVRAIALMHRQNPRASVKLLEKALRNEAGDATLLQTLNNMGCTQRSLGRTVKALEIMTDAVNTHGPGGSDLAVATIRLNMGSLHSQLGRHHDAIQEISAAMRSTHRTLIANGGDSPADDSDTLPATIVLLALIYHAMGVEYDYLHDSRVAISWYRRAFRMAHRHIGTRDGLTLQLRNSLRSAKKAYGRS
ncbi:hypothetical protein PBRA_000810, partial [Plasmodiophora brassicae]